FHVFGRHALFQCIFAALCNDCLCSVHHDAYEIAFQASWKVTATNTSWSRSVNPDRTAEARLWLLPHPHPFSCSMGCNQFLECPVALNIIRYDDTPMAHCWPRHLELPFHMGIGMQTVVDKYIQRPNLADDLRQDLLRRAEIEAPTITQLGWYQIAREGFCTEWRQID